MAPKKNVESKLPGSTKKTQAKKVTKLKVKELKPKLKTPTVIKLKIPFESLNNSKNMSPMVAKIQEISPKLTKKQLTFEKKLDLANEVAAAQLGNKEHTILETAPIVIAAPKAKRGRRKKKEEPVEPIATTERNCSTDPSRSTEHSGSTNVSPATHSEDAFDVTPKKRIYLRRNPTKATAKNPEAVQSTKDESSLSLSLKKKSIKQTKLTDAKSGIIKTPKVDRKPKQISPSAALIIESRTRKKKLRPEIGKTDTKETSDPLVLQSPSILDQEKTSNLKNENKPANTEAGSPRSDSNVEPCAIDSRKTSLTSECLSWTKDISSSSTTTCVTVCSTDIVRIDKKMPIIKLTPTTCNLNQDYINTGVYNTGADMESSSSDSDSSESEQTPTGNAERECTPEMESRSLNLSSPSLSPKKSPRPASPSSLQNSVNNDEMNKITYCIDKLTSKLKHFDLEIINWIGYENEEVDLDRKKFQESIFKMLKEESEVISHCRHLKKILSDNAAEEDANEKSKESVAQEEETKKVDSNVSDNNANDRYPPQVIRERSDEENNYPLDRVRYLPFDQSCDDDDALSLFAESITGIESSRRNSSAASMCTTGDFEEYVPYALDSEKWEPAKKISYPPPCSVEKQNDIKTKPVCEKQNADSTSIYKESEQYSTVNNSVLFEKNIPPLNVNAGMPYKKRPCLMSYIFKPLLGVKSGVFQGMCFFNILSSCKKNNCRFPHVIPSYDEITTKLIRLSEETFIQEYMLMRNWPVLRRKYGMCFVHECIRRDLTRILVEMALDFIMKANESCRDDTILKVLVSECVLLHLNNVDLKICEDLLMYKYQGELLCEIFMQVIANTQNFSRFKQVFINLTKFILRQDRTFSLDVATQILERICILPCELPLLEALLEIVKHTDQAILMNSMLGHFENQLSVTSKELFEELLKMKKEGSMNRPVLQNLYESSPKANPAEIEPVNANPLVSEREKRYTSPDTTNLDSMNKATDEPIITRTIDFNRGQVFGCTIQRSFSNSNSSNDSSEEFRPKVVSKPNFSSWRDRSIFNSILGPGQRSSTPRPMLKRHVHQQLNFGPSAPKFPRRSGPDFF